MDLLLHILLATAAAAPAPGGVEELWVKAGTPAERAILADLPLGFAEGEEDGWMRMHAEPAGITALERSGLRWVPTARTLMPPPESYLSPVAMEAALEALAEAHPDRVRVVDLGWSHSGQQIVGVRISDTDSPGAQWRIAGAHHGDETSSAEVTLAAATVLAGGGDLALETLLSDDAVWLIPHVNPDGVAALSRYNANNVDLNRNYGYEWSSREFRPGAHPFSEPETRNMRALSAWVPFGAALSLHSGATNLGWVWNFTTDPSPDAGLVEAVAEAYEEECDQPGFYITNGAEWYITHGDTNDWAYGRHGTQDYTLEVSHVKNPMASAMEATVEFHTAPVIAFLQWPWQLRGEVVDSVTDRGIPAVIRVEDDGWPLQTGPMGRFARPVQATVLNLTISAPGYTAQTLTVDPTETATLRVALLATERLEGRPEPVLLSRDSDGRFALDVDTLTLTLSRPGEVSVSAEPIGSVWSVDPDALAPGPWNLITDAGVVLRSLFIGELDEAVVVHHMAEDGPTRRVLTGEGFGRGTQVWGLWGEDRAYTPLNVLEATTERLVIEHEALAERSTDVDLVILSNGRQLVIPGTPVAEEDTGAPEEDTGVPRAQETGRPPDTDGDAATDPVELDEAGKGGGLTTCACATGMEYPPAWLLVSLPAWLSRRRRRP